MKLTDSGFSILTVWISMASSFAMIVAKIRPSFMYRWLRNRERVFEKGELRMNLRRFILVLCLPAFVLTACSAAPQVGTPISTPIQSIATLVVSTPVSVDTLAPTAAPPPLVPDFEHIVIVVFENRSEE